MSFVSYAQNYEDVFLHRIFGGQETGFYVDVGACHPVEGSVTKALYDRGWSGINIEPGSIFQQLAAARPRDVNLQVAVLDRGGEAPFVENEQDPGMSRLSDGTAEPTARMVPCETLEAIVSVHSKGRPIDLVKIDAEGAEAAIVNSTDWRRLRPRVLILEATKPWSTNLANQDWEPKLVEEGYVRLYFDGINCFYAPAEEAPLLQRHFAVPVNVLDRTTRYDAAHIEAQQNVARQSVELAGLREMIDAMKDDIARLSASEAALTKTAAGLERERDLLANERDLLASERDARRAENANLLARLLKAGTEPSPPAVRPGADAEPAVLTEIPRADLDLRRRPSPDRSSRPARNAARAAYGMVRPVVRPIAWRLRTFMTGELLQRIRKIEDELQSSRRPAERVEPPGVQVVSHSEPGLRALAEEMERVLLTLAMEATQSRNGSAGMPAAASGARPDGDDNGCMSGINGG